jgi:prefoldin subunit 5
MNDQDKVLIKAEIEAIYQEIDKLKKSINEIVDLVKTVKSDTSKQ